MKQRDLQRLRINQKYLERLIDNQSDLDSIRDAQKDLQRSNQRDLAKENQRDLEIGWRHVERDTQRTVERLRKQWKDLEALETQLNIS